MTRHRSRSHEADRTTRTPPASERRSGTGPGGPTLARPGDGRTVALQRAADDAPRGVRAARLTNPTAPVQRVFDDWIVDAILEDKEEIAAELRAPPEGMTAWHVMLERLTRLGVSGPAAEDTRALLQRVLADVPAQETGAPAVTDAVLVHEADDTFVYLDSHQNKHQHASAMIAALGTWSAKKGTLFGPSEGLAWHAANTARTIATWAVAQKLKPGAKAIPKKVPMDDGIIYDATAEMDESGRLVVIYHCNPPTNRP